jgi:hypothetical protein
MNVRLLGPQLSFVVDEPVKASEQFCKRVIDESIDSFEGFHGTVRNVLYRVVQLLKFLNLISILCVLIL